MLEVKYDVKCTLTHKCILLYYIKMSISSIIFNVTISKLSSVIFFFFQWNKFP